MSTEYEYSTHYDGKFTTVYKTEDAVRAILCRNERNLNRIEQLEAENKKLKDKAWKDKKLQEMKEQLDQMRADYYRGFPISEQDMASINRWKKKHDAEAHGLTTDTLRVKAGGVSGGRYSYHFVPTSLGTSGIVRCSCGAEFEFQEIG